MIRLAQGPVVRKLDRVIAYRTVVFRDFEHSRFFKLHKILIDRSDQD
jgi:hypothetical protein